MITTLFTTISLSLGLPTGLLSSLCYVESKHKINVIHKDDGSEDSLGICQIHYTTAKELGFRGSAKDLMKPENNILYAGLYLKKQIKRYKSIKRGVIAYNRGNAIFLISTSYQNKVYKQWRKHYDVKNGR